MHSLFDTKWVFEQGCVCAFYQESDVVSVSAFKMEGIKGYLGGGWYRVQRVQLGSVLVQDFLRFLHWSQTVDATGSIG